MSFFCKVEIFPQPQTLDCPVSVSVIMDVGSDIKPFFTHRKSRRRELQPMHTKTLHVVLHCVQCLKEQEEGAFLPVGTDISLTTHPPLYHPDPDWDSARRKKRNCSVSI